MKKIAVAITLFLSVHSMANDLNFRFSPIGLLIGAVDATLDIKMNPNWTLGPKLTYLNFEISSNSINYKESAYGLGVRGNWFKNGAYQDGLYVGPAAGWHGVKVTGNSYSAEVSAVSIGCLVGYGWFWESFNQMLGGGIATALGGTKVTIKDSNGATVNDVELSGFSGLSIEYSLGWTF